MYPDFFSVVHAAESTDSVQVFGVIVGLGVAIIIGAFHTLRGNDGIALWLGYWFGLFAGCIAAEVFDTGGNPLWILIIAYLTAAIVGTFTSMLE